MAKYDKETKFYWLQLKEDFFEDDAIEWLEEQKPNGRDYAYFYLKLCLKSLKSNGILIRQVGNILIPYDNRKLAELTKMDFDTVTVAMELLKQIGLVQILDNGEIYMTQLENLIGSVSKGALKKQRQRLLKETVGGQLSTKDKDKDKVKDKIKDKNIFKKPTLEEVEQYCKERNNNINPKSFFDYYETDNWKDVKNWKKKLITWEMHNTNQPKKETREEKMDRIMKWAEEEDKKEEEKKRNEQERNKRPF